MTAKAAAGLAAAALALSGCVAELTQTRKRTYGPVPEVGLIEPGAGDVRYALKGPESLVRRRRADAFKKMAKYCGGEGLFRVTEELTRDDAETPFHTTDLDPDKLMGQDHYKVETYRHIRFECEAKR